MLQIAENLGNRLAQNRNYSSDKTIDNDSEIVHLNDSEYITIPEYPTRIDEPLEKRRQR